MADLRTTYLGTQLSSPIVVGASPYSKKVDTIRALEDAGAGGLVIKSLFEEQIQFDAESFRQEVHRLDDQFAEASSYFPQTEYAGAREHISWVAQARQAVKMPLFASLNCVRPGTWPEYERRLEETGVNGLEVNFYSPALDANTTAADIERSETETVAAIRAAVKIPIAVKLHPYYTSLPNVLAYLEKAGASGFVLFNRLFHPDIDVEKQVERSRAYPSDSRDSLPSLRWLALLSGSVKSDLVANTGISSGTDVAKMILAGANSVQVVSTLADKPAARMQQLRKELSDWMDTHGHADLAAFRGKLNRKNSKNPWTFERGQYIKAIVGVE